MTSSPITVTDGLGNTATSTISIDIKDDVPTAQADTNAAASGQTVTGNVETNDTAGADGIASIAWAGAVGDTVTLAPWRSDVRRHWRLQLSRQSEHLGHRRVRLHDHGRRRRHLALDADDHGDQRPAVGRRRRPRRWTRRRWTSTTIGADLAAGTVTGSTPASTAETTTGTLTFSDPDAPVTVTGVAAGNAGSDVSGNVGTNVTGIYGLLHVNADGSYTYTLTTPFDTTPDADNGTNTEPARTSSPSR